MSPLIHLDYRVNKSYHTENFWVNYEEHQDRHPQVPHWVRVFKNVDCEQEIKDLNLEGLNVFPRYSFIPAGKALAPHIDEDEIIGINFSLMPHPISIRMDGVDYEYEAAVCDVGHVIHSVEPVDYDRLMLKFAIRAPWEIVLERTHDKTIR